MRRANSTILWSLLLGAVSLTAAAAAAPAGGLFSGHTPVQVSADGFSTDDATHTATYTGRAEFTQGDKRLRADKVVIYFGDKSLGQAASSPAGGLKGFSRMDADGNVFFVQTGQVIRGDHATYEAASKTLRVTGAVVLERGDDVMAGSRLVVHMGDNSATLDNDTGTNRVRSILYPHQDVTTAASAPAPAKH